MSPTITSAFFVAFLIGATHATSSYSDPHFAGNRSVIVQLMEWKWSEIAKECEIFLGPYGYGGVQTSPVTENAVINNRPWWERYQPVSYKLITRSGDENQFRDMVDRCNKAGVRIYVDIILNHMTGGGSGQGTAGSSWSGDSQSYPAVPYSNLDFHDNRACHSGDMEIHNYDDATECRNCRLVGLRDLDQSKEYVRQKQVELINHLIDIGVAGFRSDASKHIWPADLMAIFSKANNLNTKYFNANSRPFVIHEVYTSQHVPYTDYITMGRPMEFQFGVDMTNVVRKNNNQKLKYLKNFGEGWGYLKSEDAVSLIDNHDRQRQTQFISFSQPKELKISTAFMLALPYGVPKIMSSYSFRNKQHGNDEGPPNDNGVIKDVKRNPDMSCDYNDWVCEHRWRQIYNMVGFRNVAGFDKIDNWWDNGNNAIAFSRGNKAFIAINNDDNNIDTNLKTGLPAGQYCDIMSGSKINGKCSGKQITVNGDGSAHILVDHQWEDPMVAFHVQSKL